jgi:hypothetical protein
MNAFVLLVMSFTASAAAMPTSPSPVAAASLLLPSALGSFRRSCVCDDVPALSSSDAPPSAALTSVSTVWV